MKRNKFLTVTLLAIGATLFGSFMGAGVKLLSDDLHPIIICFYRCLMGLIIITPFVARNNFKALQTDNMRLQIFRALINIISMICWFSAIGMMHFEKATALGFTTPLFTTVLAVLILGEVIRFHRTAALLLGFIGSFVQYFMTTSYKYADATILVTLRYIAIPLAGLSGYIIWNEVPSHSQTIGGIFILASCLFITLREMKIKKIN